MPGLWSAPAVALALGRAGETRRAPLGRVRVTLRPEQIREAWYLTRPPKRPLWARVVLTYSFGWFVAGELVGIALAALTLRIF